MNKTVLTVLMLALASASGLRATKELESPSSWKELGTKWGAEPDSQGVVHDDRTKQIRLKKFADSKTFYGTVEFEKTSFCKNLTCYGSARLTGSEVQGVTTMYGTLSAFGSTFKDMDVRAAEKNENQDTTLVLDTCQVTHLFLEGRLETSKSKLSSLKIVGNDVVCIDSTISDNIVIMASPSKSKRVVIELTNSVVEGSITFSQKGGIVICNGNSEVKGGVFGGTIEIR